MTTDRELLELLQLSAKVAGIVVVRSRLDDPMHKDMLIEKSARNQYQMVGPWAPHTNDGDSRRLATRLHLVVASMRGDHERPAFSTCYHFNGPEYSSEPHGDDPDGATRLAVLRTAAAIGKALQSKSANSEALGLQ